MVKREKNKLALLNKGHTKLFIGTSCHLYLIKSVAHIEQYMKSIKFWQYSAVVFEAINN